LFRYYFFALIKGKKELCIFFLDGAGAGFLLSGLKTYNCGSYSFSLSFFALLFVRILLVIL